MEDRGPKRANWVENFKIPWYKFPQPLLDGCENKARPTPKHRREMIRILCEDIRQHCAFPGRKTLAKISEMVVAKYSYSFRDDIGDTVLGTGFESFRKQMEERLYNESRREKKLNSLTKKLNSSNDEDLSAAEKVRKKPMSDSYGCVNWQPNSYPKDENEESQKEKQEWLSAEFTKKERDKKTVALYMKQTYASQRLLINRGKPNIPSIQEVKNQWPFLFETDMLLQHFEQLMGFNLQIVLQQSLEKKASAIYEFMKQERMKTKKVREVLLEIDTAMRQDDSKIPQTAGSYLLLLAFFEEPEDQMIRCYDVRKSTRLGVQFYCT